MRANGLDSTDGLSVEEDKKGAFYVLDIDEKGGALADALADFMPGLIEGFQWPKSMRWGSGTLRWVRPLRAILCLFDGQPVRFSIGGLKAATSLMAIALWPLKPSPFPTRMTMSALGQSPCVG